MTLAIRGGRASCLTLQLGPGTWLLAVAHGFGRVGGVAAEAALLDRMRAECERRMRGARFRRAIDRPQSAATAILSVLARVNSVLHASTASHDDYVTAAASLTTVVVVHGIAYVIHAGATAAYLARDGEILPLCVDDVVDERHVPLVMRALIAAPVLDVSVTSSGLEPGDAIVLLARRIRGYAERAAVLTRLEASDPGEQMLVARFQDDPVARGAEPLRVECHETGALLARVLAAVAFVLAAVIAH